MVDLAINSVSNGDSRTRNTSDSPQEQRNVGREIRGFLEPIHDWIQFVGNMDISLSTESMTSRRLDGLR